VVNKEGDGIVSVREVSLSLSLSPEVRTRGGPRGLFFHAQ